ncbi:MAG: phosphotransferase [Actinobacteria bacterium]|nr:phosphotransferase [Actinomycetota bacterium]
MPLEWLFTLAGASPMGRDWLVRLGWRGRAGAAVVYWFANDHRRPTGVAKVPAGIAGDDMGAEDVALRTLGPAARAAGARVPEVVRSASRESAGALLLTAVEGHPAARLLARRPQQLPALLDSLVAWLSAWNFATYVAADDTGGGHLLEAVAVARKVENRAPEAAGYASWLDGLCAEVASQVPTVAAHNDLTMWNVLVGSGNEISVLDWEAARPDGLPLADLFYTLVDAVAAATKSARLDALRACFTAPGRVLHVARALASRFGYVERLPPEVIDVCFHACWLLHADDALRRRAGQTDEEFIQIAEWLARERPRVSALLLT